MDYAGQDLLSRAWPFPIVDRYDGALYNNVNLVQSAVKLQGLNNILCEKKLSDSSVEEQAAFVFSWAVEMTESFPSKLASNTSLPSTMANHERI